MIEKKFDVFVIGAGSGGVRAARLAASQGKKVAIAEEFRYGGTCVIRGCVPKKLMVNAADFGDSFADSKGFGWDVENPFFSWKKFVHAKNTEIERLENIYFDNLEKNGVKMFGCRAQLLSSNKILLADGMVCDAKIILIATGSQPFVPDFHGREHAITSNEVFNLKKLPSRMVIVGGGYIASEFSSIFNGLGVDVTQVYRGKKLLRGFDYDIRAHVMASMVQRGVNVVCNVDVIKCDNKGNELLIKLSDGSVIGADCFLLATGRTPNTANLGLDRTGVRLDNNGAIKVNKWQQTSVSSIYAIGDVTDRLNLTPVAIRDAIAFVETAIKNNPLPSDHDLVPTAVFTRPEVGTVGLTEEQASKRFSIEVFKTKFKPLANVIAGREEVTIMKMIVDKETGKVLGCHLIGPGSAELIQLAAVVVKMGATKEDFDKTCAVHPTIAEELVTLS